MILSMLGGPGLLRADDQADEPLALGPRDEDRDPPRRPPRLSQDVGDLPRPEPAHREALPGRPRGHARGARGLRHADEQVPAPGDDRPGRDQPHRDDPELQRVPEPPHEDVRLREEDDRHLGRHRGLLLRRRPPVQEVRNAPPELRRHRDLGRSDRLRRDVRELRRVGRTAVGHARRDPRRQARHDEAPADQPRARGVHRALLLRAVERHTRTRPIRSALRSPPTTPGTRRRSPSRKG